MTSMTQVFIRPFGGRVGSPMVFCRCATGPSDGAIGRIWSKPGASEGLMVFSVPKLQRE